MKSAPATADFCRNWRAASLQVTALDNSPAMLELARQVCEREKLANVSLQLADALNGVSLQADCVVLNMVLHHFAAPAEALKHMAELAATGR